MRNYGITFSSGDLTFAKFHYGLEVFWILRDHFGGSRFGLWILSTWYHFAIFRTFFVQTLGCVFLNAMSSLVPWDSSPWNTTFFGEIWFLHMFGTFFLHAASKTLGNFPRWVSTTPGKQVSVASSWSAWCSRRIGDRELIRTAVDADVARFWVKRSWLSWRMGSQVLLWRLTWVPCPHGGLVQIILPFQMGDFAHRAPGKMGPQTSPKPQERQKFRNINCWWKVRGYLPGVSSYLVISGSYHGSFHILSNSRTSMEWISWFF